MPIADAIAAIKQQLTDFEVVDTPDIVTQGQRPTAAVYRAGTVTNIHGEKTYDVAILLTIPASMEFVTGDDIERVQQAGEDLLDWFVANHRDVGGMRVFWPAPPAMSDITTGNRSAGNLAVGDAAEIQVSVTVCEEYPRR